MRGYISLLKPLRRVGSHQKLGVNFYSREVNIVKKNKSLQVVVFENHNAQNQRMLLLLHLNIKNVVHTVLLKLHINNKDGSWSPKLLSCKRAKLIGWPLKKTNYSFFCEDRFLERIVCALKSYVFISIAKPKSHRESFIFVHPNKIFALWRTCIKWSGSYDY